MRKLIRRLQSTLPRVSAVQRAFLPRIRPHRLKLAGALALGLVTAATEVLKPWPLQLVFDHVLAPSAKHAPHALGAWLRLQPEAGVIAGAALLVVLASALGGIAAYAQTMLLSDVGQRVVARLRRDLFRHLMVLPPAFHGSRRQGDLLMRLTGDIMMLRELLVGGMLDAAAAVLVLAGTLATMLWMDAKLTLLSLAIVPAIAIAGSLLGERIRGMVRKNRDREGQLAGHAAEALGAVPMLQAFGASERMTEVFERTNRSSLRSGLKASRLEAVLARSLDLFTAAGAGVTLALGAWSVRHGSLTPGELLVFLAYQRTLYKPVRQLARLAGRSAKSAACGERVLEILETVPDVADAPGAITAPRLAGDIAFEHVTLQYPRGDVALRDVSLRVRAGQVVVLRGESGSGKSTLLSLLPRLLDPTDGVVRFDGEDARAFTLASLRAQVSMVFQESVLMGMTVRENILIGRPDATEADVEAAAHVAGVMRFASDLPQGLDTVVGERGAQLSGGQRQRVALARAALRDAPILVLDEPFAHLDDVSRDHVLAALRDVSRGRTVLLVTHQDHPGLTADLDVTLAGGRIVAMRERGPADARHLGAPA